MTRTFLVLPSPCGRTTVPRTIWSACLGSTPRRSVTSTVSSNFAHFTFCRSGTASCKVYCRASTCLRAALIFLPALPAILFRPFPVFHGDCVVSQAVVCVGSLRYDFDAHGAGGSLHALDRRFNRCRIQIRHLGGGDLAHLSFGYASDFVFVRSARTFSDTRSALQKNRGGRRFGDEGEAAVGVDGDHHGDDEPGHLFVLRASVELLAELHDVDLRLAESGADRRGRSGFACLDLQLDAGLYLLRRCHNFLLLLARFAS